MEFVINVVVVFFLIAVEIFAVIGLLNIGCIKNIVNRTEIFTVIAAFLGAATTVLANDGVSEIRKKREKSIEEIVSLKFLFSGLFSLLRNVGFDSTTLKNIANPKYEGIVMPIGVMGSFFEERDYLFLIDSNALLYDALKQLNVDKDKFVQTVAKFNEVNKDLKILKGDLDLYDGSKDTKEKYVAELHKLSDLLRVHILGIMKETKRYFEEKYYPERIAEDDYVVVGMNKQIKDIKEKSPELFKKIDEWFTKGH